MTGNEKSWCFFAVMMLLCIVPAYLAGRHSGLRDEMMRYVPLEEKCARALNDSTLLFQKSEARNARLVGLAEDIGHGLDVCLDAFRACHR